MKEDTTAKKKYPAKVSYGLLAFVFLVFFGPLVPVIIEDAWNEKAIGVLGLLLLIYAFVLYLFFDTNYLIEGKQLKIKCGFFSYKPIDIDNIKEISKTNSPISSPAPSFDRIEIKYGEFDDLIISPKDKVQFAQDLCAINPNIKNKLQ